MNNILNYVNELMMNNEDNSESILSLSDDEIFKNSFNNTLSGGQIISDQDIPTGGFPPIVHCDKSETKPSDSDKTFKKKIKGVKFDTSVISIADIIKKTENIEKYKLYI